MSTISILFGNCLPFDDTMPFSDAYVFAHVIDIEGDENKTIRALIEALEVRKLRIFHRELNAFHEDPCCMEFSLIRLDWTNWNSAAKFELPPVKWSEKIRLNLLGWD